MFLLSLPPPLPLPPFSQYIPSAVALLHPLCGVRERVLLTCLPSIPCPPPLSSQDIPSALPEEALFRASSIPSLLKLTALRGAAPTDAHTGDPSSQSGASAAAAASTPSVEQILQALDSNAEGQGGGGAAGGGASERGVQVGGNTGGAVKASGRAVERALAILEGI